MVNFYDKRYLPKLFYYLCAGYETLCKYTGIINLRYSACYTEQIL